MILSTHQAGGKSRPSPARSRCPGRSPTPRRGRAQDSLTNGFSKKLNLKAAVSVFMAWYNFCRVHQTLRVTPAMEAGLTDHIWTIQGLLVTDIRQRPLKQELRTYCPD